MGLLEPFIPLDESYITRRLGFHQALANCSGKIWLLCDHNFECTILVDHGQFLHVRLSSPLLPSSLFLTVVYASCKTEDRVMLWEKLLEIRPPGDELWLVGGDFNVITGPTEHSLGKVAKPGATRDFNNFIMLAGLLDAGFVGDPYTWTNNRVWKRLDRVLLSPSWSGKNFGVKITHVSRAMSDHCPLLLSFPAFGLPKSSFRFQNMWIRHAGFLLTVRLNWALPCSGTGMQKLQIKLRRLKEHLKWWNAGVFGNIHEKVQVAESNFALAEKNFDANPSLENKVEMAKTQAVLQKVLYMEEDFWKQRAAVRWMGEGDRNTKLFHQLAQKRRLNGRIFRIWEDGSCIDDPELIQASGAAFFEKLLAEGVPELNPASMENIPQLISSGDNLALLATPTIEEVKEVVWGMCKESAAGPDGFSVAFYVSCWEIIKSDVYEAVLDFFRGNSLPRGMAATTIVLIPKIDGAQRWQDFRPISLCNVSNKIISKLLANRLGKVLEKIISPMQSGFVAGRVISDNILMAQELHHKLNFHVRGGNLILKLDMAKAYDRVQWDFLFQVMRAFGFSDLVIDILRRCIADCWFSVRINGQLSGFFHSKRGIRQGDPISPLLFIIAAEFFSRGLDKLFARFPQMYYATGCDFRISHLAYADDVMVFLNGSINNVKRIMGFLNAYMLCSGQLINFSKSSFFPAKRISNARKMQISSVSGFSEGRGSLLYLGVPIISGNKKAIHFQPLLEKVLMPPKSILHQLEMICANFFWGSVASRGKAHWISWETICKPKGEGGLGVRKLLEVSTAISLKLWFRFRTQASPWAVFLTKMYCGAVSSVVVPLKWNASPGWRRMMRIRDLAENQIGWTIGKGRIRFWHDGWLDRGPLFRSCEVVGNPEALVSDFWGTDGWNTEKLRAVLPTAVAAEVEECDIQDEDDSKMIWKPSPQGFFTLKSAWNCIRVGRQFLDIRDAIWSKILIPKISIFSWRYLLKRLPVDSILQARGVGLVSKCQHCGSMESWEHLFFHCKVAKEVWEYFAGCFKVDDFTIIEKWRVGETWLKQGHIREACPFMILWFLWEARNDAKHREIKWSTQQIIGKTVQYMVFGVSAGIIKGIHWKGFLGAAKNLGIKVIQRRVHTVQVVRWMKPAVGSYKLNSDGCSKGNPGLASYGFVIRDHNGQVLKARHGIIGVASNVIAELVAIRKGLELCVVQNYFPLWLESDSMTALYIIAATTCNWELRKLVLKIKKIINVYYVRCTHIYREANKAADYLANKAFNMEGDRLLEGDLKDRELLGICKLDKLDLELSVKGSCLMDGSTGPRKAILSLGGADSKLSEFVEDSSLILAAERFNGCAALNGSVVKEEKSCVVHTLTADGGNVVGRWVSDGKLCDGALLSAKNCNDWGSCVSIFCSLLSELLVACIAFIYSVALWIWFCTVVLVDSLGLIFESHAGIEMFDGSNTERFEGLLEIQEIWVSFGVKYVLVDMSMGNRYCGQLMEALSMILCLEILSKLSLEGGWLIYNDVVLYMASAGSIGDGQRRWLDKAEQEVIGMAGEAFHVLTAELQYSEKWISWDRS
ncbi:uncharacterized protein LOC141815220 [Curcuma longa]|uniref:uncharacterized protein LOC141815220 n=1 Tax=Curcuma longa TaxID=136217 RepID=UPI003D9E80C0